MKSEYVFRCLDDAEAEQELARFDTASPFCTVPYARSLRMLGGEPWLVGAYRGEALADAAIACIHRSRFTASMELPHLPASAEDPDFWKAIGENARQNRVIDLKAHSFDSRPLKLDPLPGEYARRQRLEFILPLAGDFTKGFRENHRRNVKKAIKAGVTIRRGSQREYLPAHIHVMEWSKQRRESRGESIQSTFEAREYVAYLESGAGELFQAVQGEEVLSSILVLRSSRRAYLQTSGSSGNGMSVGSAHFLVSQIALAFQAEGFEEFNLGGAPEGSTLAEFKLGFGCQVLHLPSASCQLGPPWKRKVRTLARLLKEDRASLAGLMSGSRTRFLVFGLDLTADTNLLTVPGAEFRPLGEEDLLRLKNPPGYSDFRQKQIERLRRFGGSYAYAVYLEGQLAHIRWMIPAEKSSVEQPQLLDLQPDEGEITASETFPEFRGRGLSPFAIQQVAALARERGLRRIYGKTTEDNIASQRSMTKAGFKPIGYVDVIQPPLQPGKRVVKRSIQWS